MIGIGTIIYYMHRSHRRARANDSRPCIIYYYYILNMISEFCVFSTGRSGHVRCSSGDGLLCILLLLLLYRTRTMMTVPSQLARARARRLIFNGKTRLFVAGFLIIFPTPLPAIPDTAYSESRAYNGFFSIVFVPSAV